MGMVGCEAGVAIVDVWLNSRARIMCGHEDDELYAIYMWSLPFAFPMLSSTRNWFGGAVFDELLHPFQVTRFFLLRCFYLFIGNFIGSFTNFKLIFILKYFFKI